MVTRRAKRAHSFWRSAGLLLQNIGGFFGMLSLAKLAQVKGRRIAFALSLLLGIAVLPFLPETKNQPLPDE